MRLKERLFSSTFSPKTLWHKQETILNLYFAFQKKDFQYFKVQIFHFAYDSKQWLFLRLVSFRKVQCMHHWQKADAEKYAF
jgi:hypothetical protein